MRYEEKVCPLLQVAQSLVAQTDLDAPPDRSPTSWRRCIGPKCAWFDDNAMECAVMVLATRFYEGR